MAVLHFAVELNCLIKELYGCANWFENKYIALEKSVKSTLLLRNVHIVHK